MSRYAANVALQSSCSSCRRLHWRFETATCGLSLAISHSVIKCLTTCRFRFVYSARGGQNAYLCYLPADRV